MAAAAASIKGQRKIRDLEEEEEDSSSDISFSLSSEESEMEPEEERIRYSKRLNFEKVVIKGMVTWKKIKHGYVGSYFKKKLPGNLRVLDWEVKKAFLTS